MAAEKLSPEDIEKRLESLTHWSLVSNKLHRELTFEDFAEAFAFMGRVAVVAEELHHHPEWFNVWNRVVIDLATHDVGGISNYDFELAERIDALV